jgi:hypothetical protein
MDGVAPAAEPVGGSMTEMQPASAVRQHPNLQTAS